MVDNDPARMRSVVDELREIINDVHEEFTPALDGAPEELRVHMWGVTEAMFKASSGDAAKLFDLFTTLQLLMLLAGREHHARGFASPMERHQDENLVTDTDIERFIEGLPE
jgi:hypothetical protein